MGKSSMTPYYKEKLEQGLKFQDFVVDKLYDLGLPIVSFWSKKYQDSIGENKTGIEIKNDNRFRETGNFYIETAEKTRPENPDFVPSGIYRKDNTWLYLIGDYQSIYIFSKQQLQRVENRYEKKEIGTSRGFVIPVENARKGLVLREIHFLEK